MSVLREYIKAQLIDPLRIYPTKIQDTLLTIITDRLEELYEYTKKFPEIITPNANRLDIVQAILKQFQFTIMNNADIYEQVSILENILYVYNRRGSIDTIENMWKYYGGNLPKDIKVRIPSYNLFRYSMSKFSGQDVFQDGELNRAGVYEILLYNNTYPVEEFRDFVVKELLSAGSKVYFRNNVYAHLTGDQAAYVYDISYKNYKHKLEMSIATYRRGLIFSGLGAFSSQIRYSYLSGTPDLFFEVKHLRDIGSKELGSLSINTYNPFNTERLMRTPLSIEYIMDSNPLAKYIKYYLGTSYTPEVNNYRIERYLYDINGDLISSTFPGYFVLGETLLGSEVL